MMPNEDVREEGRKGEMREEGWQKGGREHDAEYAELDDKGCRPCYEHRFLILSSGKSSAENNYGDSLMGPNGRW